MKLFVALSLYFFVNIGNVFANDLSQEQEDFVLGKIDDICGDTWCEGDFDSEFKQLDCDFASSACTLKFDYIWYLYADDSSEVTGELRKRQSCELTGVASYEYMLEDILNSGYITLSEPFYWLIGDTCVDANLPAAYAFVREQLRDSSRF